MDEPTIGLDVSVKDNIRRAITQINHKNPITKLLNVAQVVSGQENGCFFLLIDLGDIEQLCDRIFMIDKGQEIFDGTVSQLKS